MMLWRSSSVWDYSTGLQTTPAVIINQVLTRTGSCSVVQMIRATRSKSLWWDGWSFAAWSQPSHWHWAYVTPSPSTIKAEKSHMTGMGFEPKTFPPTVQSAHHYTTWAYLPRLLTRSAIVSCTISYSSITMGSAAKSSMDAELPWWQMAGCCCGLQEVRLHQVWAIVD